MTTQALRLLLELQRSAGPIEGRLIDEGGGIVAFAGWLEFIAAVEKARAAADPSSDEPGDIVRRET